MISGFFIKYDIPVKEYVVKNLKRIMIPYIIFSLLGLLAGWLKTLAPSREPLNLLFELKGIFFTMNMKDMLHTYAFVLWFLPTLFWSKIILYFIHKFTRNKILVSFITVLLFMISFKVELPFALDNAFNAILWVYMGFLIFNYRDEKFMYAAPVGLALIWSIWSLPILDVATKNYSNIFHNLAFAGLLIISMIIVIKHIRFNKLSRSVFSMWGQGTMLLFIAHVYTNNIAYIVGQRIPFGGWVLKFALSLVMLQVLLLIKSKFNNRGIFRYV